MPEVLNFAVLTDRLVEQLFAAHPHDDELLSAAIRLVWNTRGTVDVDRLETTLCALMGRRQAQPFLQKLARELRKLDR